MKSINDPMTPPLQTQNRSTMPPHTLTSTSPCRITPTPPPGESCGGACFSEGLCEEGLVCGPSPADDAFAREPANAQVKDFLDHILGRAAVGICSKAAPTTRELRELPNREGERLDLRNEGGGIVCADRVLTGPIFARTTGGIAPPCVGCPTGVDPNSEFVVEAAAAGVGLMQEGGFFPEAQAGETASLVKVVSGTSQVVSGIRYDLVVAVARSSRPSSTAEYYRIDVVSQPWVQPPYRLLGARPLTAQEAEQVEAAVGANKGKGKGKRGLLAAAGEAVRRAAARLR